MLKQALILKLSTLWYISVGGFNLFVLWDALRPKHRWLRYLFPLVLCMMIIPYYNIYVATFYWQSQGKDISFLKLANTGKSCQACQQWCNNIWNVLCTLSHLIEAMHVAFLGWGLLEQGGSCCELLWVWCSRNYSSACSGMCELRVLIRGAKTKLQALGARLELTPALLEHSAWYSA